MCVSPVILYLINVLYIQPKFDKEGRYTIGIVNSFLYPKGGGCNLFYTYNVNGKNQKGSSVEPYNHIDRRILNKRFIINFVSGDVSLSKFLLECPVPDSIKISPPNGWKDLPIWAKNKSGNSITNYIKR